MAREAVTASDRAELEPADRILQITVAANQIAAGNPNANPYELRNALLETRRLAKVRYKNGITLPASAAKLRADAGRDVRHSRILGRNIRNATGVTRHSEADAHHIVALSKASAKDSRDLLFDWGIGINDADNGVYLPRSRNSKIPGLEDAPPHQSIHRLSYDLAVFSRLNDVGSLGTADQGRLALRGIKSELLDNSFVF